MVRSDRPVGGGVAADRVVGGKGAVRRARTPAVRDRRPARGQGAADLAARAGRRGQVRAGTVAVGVPFEGPAPGYFATDDLPGAKAFAIWPLEQAAESTFGSSHWPAEHPVPQAWIELDVASPEAVAAAVAELRGAGYAVLRGAQLEPWGQTTSRLLSPESLLVGISHTPWMHPGE